MRRALIAAAALTAAVGCSRPAAPPPGAAAGPAPAVPGPMVDSPDYANWKRFPVGTVVVRKAVTSTETAAGTTTSVETFTLREATDREVVVDRQNTTERSDGSYRAVNPPDQRRYARRFALPPGLTADAFTKPSPTAKSAGEEAVKVARKEYRAAVYTWTDQTESGPLAVKVWLSDEVPGRVVRQTMTLAKLKNTTVEEVTEVKVP